MNKILIVGHPQSGYREVERLLRSCGMGPAQPSRREGLLPEQISNLLRKAHGCLPLNRLGNGREVRQIGAAPIWHGLALDLMLGNIEQALWGWSDPDAVHLLDYWRELDPDLHFILVYDRPETVLTRMSLREAGKLSAERLRQRLESWTAYNAALLDFHREHARRSLLVHADQVRLSEQHDGVDPVRVDQPGQHRGPLTERALEDVGIQGAAVEAVTGLEDDATHLGAAPLQPQRQAIEEGAHGPLQQQHAASLQQVCEGRIAGHRLGSRIQRTATSGRMGNQGEHGDRCENTGICRLGPGGTAADGMPKRHAERWAGASTGWW